MKIQIHHKIAGAFLAGLVYLASLGGIAYQSVVQLGESRAQVDRTYATLHNLDETLARVTDAESHGRGYVITGDERFLSPMRLATRAAGQRVSTLERLVADNPAQQQRLRRLGPLVRRRLASIDDATELRRTRGLGPAAELLRSGEGLAAMESVRVLIDSMAGEETALLGQRSEREKYGIRLSLGLITLGFVAAMGLSALATLVLRRYIAERVRAEAEARTARDAAEAANSAKSDFLARMSHELRTPLNSVIGFSNVLLKNRAGHFSTQELTYVERILAGGKQLLALINDVLDLSKIEAGRMQVERLPVELDALIPDIIASFEGQLRERDVELDAALPEPMAALTTDPGKLQQVIINLVGNAIKFTEDGGRVHVRVDVEGESRCPVRIDVVDTGVGIPEDRLEAIFDVFEQADSSTTRRFGGTGLGLAISRSLCRLMGYRLEVSSRLGKGSVFSIVLDPSAPRRDGAPPYPQMARTTDDQSPPSRAGIEGAQAGLVLVIDDEADSRTLLAHYVEDFGYRVVAAERAEEGLRLARECLPDLILLDLLMPGVGGWDVLRQLKGDPVLRDIPVVIVSVVASENRGGILGAVDLVDKPAARDDVLAAIRRNLRTRRGKVLLVEHEPHARALLLSYLREFGDLEVRTAATARQARERLEEERPDLLLLDLAVAVADGDGTDFLASVRGDERYGDLPIVIVTSGEVSARDLARLHADSDAVLARGASLAAGLRRTLTELWKRRAPVG